MARLFPLVAFFLHLFILPPPSASLPLRLELTHVDSKYSNLSLVDRLRRAVKRSEVRMASISSMLSASHDAMTTVRYSDGEYFADFAIGTPPVSVTALLDTGSDLIWTKCEPGSPFNPSASSTYSPGPCESSFCGGEFTSCPDGLTCRYSITYGSGSSAGTLATDTFTLGAATVPRIAFGCNIYGQGINQIPGILGMGRNQLSLVSQLDSGKFSYCLTPYGESTTSPLLFGSLVPSDASAMSTPFVSNSNYFYYLSLRGISVGGTRLPIPSSAFISDGGLFIDSGTAVTSLVSSAYDVVKQAFVSEIGLPVTDSSGTDLDLCFSASAGSNVYVPSLIFHFDGADMDLPPNNYFMEASVAGRGLLLCLVILPSSSYSIFGNFQQQNMHVVYDLEGGKLSFAPAQCDNM